MYWPGHANYMMEVRILQKCYQETPREDICLGRTGTDEMITCGEVNMTVFGRTVFTKI